MRCIARHTTPPHRPLRVCLQSAGGGRRIVQTSRRRNRLLISYLRRVVLPLADLVPERARSGKGTVNIWGGSRVSRHKKKGWRETRPPQGLVDLGLTSGAGGIPPIRQMCGEKPSAATSPHRAHYRR